MVFRPANIIGSHPSNGEGWGTRNTAARRSSRGPHLAEGSAFWTQQTTSDLASSPQRRGKMGRTLPNAGLARDASGSVYYNWLGDDLALLLAQRGGRSLAVMTEKRQPAFADDLRQPFLLVRKRGERIGVEAHDPRQR